MPKIVATLKTAAKTFNVQRNIPRPTAAQFAQMQACFAKQAAKNGGSTTPSQGGGFGGGGGRGGGGFGGGNRAAFAKCLPASLQRIRTRFTSPSQTLRQVLNPPQTNITTSAYTIGGVDQTHPDDGRRHHVAGDEGPLSLARRWTRGAHLARRTRRSIR